LRVLLLCGGTGLLGGRIAERLAEQRVPFRALVRDGSTFEPPGADVVRGDLRDPASLDAALAGVDTVVTTVTAMTRLLAGGEKTTIDATDNHGTRNLIEAAERAGVTRFLYISFAAIQPQDSYPLGRAKWENEERLRASTMREIILKPDAFQEVWLGPAVKIELEKGRMIVFGRGDNPIPYVAVDDVAEAAVRILVAADPPRSLAFGGPEALTRNEVASRLGRALGREPKVRHVPRTVLRLGSRVLAPVKQEVASVMALSLINDTRTATWDDRPLRELGIEPRPASAFIEQAAADARSRRGTP